MSAISYMLLDHPGMIEPFAEMLRRQTRSDILDGVLRRACAAAEVDRVAIEAPGVLPHLLRDVHGLIARSVRGFIDEQRLYSLGWTPPAIADGSWTLAYSGAVWGEPDIQPWAGLPNARCVMLEGAGLLAGFTHPDAVVDLLGASRPP